MKFYDRQEKVILSLPPRFDTANRACTLLNFSGKSLPRSAVPGRTADENDPPRKELEESTTNLVSKIAQKEKVNG